jgi:hypothetical protein
MFDTICTLVDELGVKDPDKDVISIDVREDVFKLILDLCEEKPKSRSLNREAFCEVLERINYLDVRDQKSRIFYKNLAEKSLRGRYSGNITRIVRRRNGLRHTPKCSGNTFLRLLNGYANCFGNEVRINDEMTAIIVRTWEVREESCGNRKAVDFVEVITKIRIISYYRCENWISEMTDVIKWFMERMNVASLDIINFGMTKEDLRRVSRMGMSELVMEDCSFPGDSLLGLVDDCDMIKNLVKLDISGYASLDDGDVAAIGKLMSLKELKMARRSLSARSIAKILQNEPLKRSLKVLDVSSSEPDDTTIFVFSYHRGSQPEGS